MFNDSLSSDRSILESVRYYSNDYLDDHFFRYPAYPLLRGGPWHVLTLTGLYLLFVTRIGPAWMSRRSEPMDIKRAVCLHNLFLVIFNVANFVTFLWATDFVSTVMYCAPVDVASSNLKERYHVNCLYLYYLSKYVDFMDTVFLVLKKKRPSKLHLFHHSVMPISLYLVYRLIPYYNLIFPAIVNSFVHVVMYAYFGLSALGPEYRRFLWWKKNITQLQLVQFMAIIVHGAYMTLDANCPKKVLFTNVSYGLVFLPLFWQFYQRQYAAVKKMN